MDIWQLLLYFIYVALSFKQSDVESKGKEREEYLLKKYVIPADTLRAREKKRKQRAAKIFLLTPSSAEKNVNVHHRHSEISPQNFGKMMNRAKKGLPKCAERQVPVFAKLVRNVSPRKQKAVLDSCDLASKIKSRA